jgi:hypothetical protein
MRLSGTPLSPTKAIAYHPSVSGGPLRGGGSVGACRASLELAGSFSRDLGPGPPEHRSLLQLQQIFHSQSHT